MSKTIKYILLASTLLIIQMLINEFVNIWPMIYIAIFPLFIFALPFKLNGSLLMICAFTYGLIIDILTEGIIGINASALLAITIFKNPIVHITVPKSVIEKSPTLICNEIYLWKQAIIYFLLFTIYFTVYIPLDSIGSFSLLYVFIRFALNIIINVVLALFVGNILVKQIIK